jgi:FkbM family methyltransferase
MVYERMKLINGTFFPDKEHHMCEFPEFKRDGTYQRGKYDMAIKQVTNKKVALDIGGHIGFWTRYMVEDFDEVVAFEPVTEHVSCWMANLDGNLDKATVYQYALGDSNEPLKINIQDDNTGGTHVDKTGKEVKQITLDEFMTFAIAPDPKRVGFVKMDCEGYETKVIQGGDKFFSENNPVVIVEQKRDRYKAYSKKDPVRLLESMGYITVSQLKGDFVLVKPVI